MSGGTSLAGLVSLTTPRGALPDWLMHVIVSGLLLDTRAMGEGGWTHFLDCDTCGGKSFEIYLCFKNADVFW